ncbi:hypothetical protein J7E70_32400 [Variovorax paradoxus]|nr:tripartite tricarboxylate transporter substrate-binding protein [Variovorax paradoxus]MBT2305112.1 hypothetical protein [Variovorax paradoxus]
MATAAASEPPHKQIPRLSFRLIFNNRRPTLLHKNYRRLALIAIALVPALSAAPSAVAQQSFPEKPSHVVVPYAAGSAIDSGSRLLADRLSKQVGQPVVVENQPGAGGRIGTERVIRASNIRAE